MFLHIGKNYVINNNNIIGIFNIEYIKNTKEYKNLYNSLQDKNDIIDLSENQQKTFILVRENQKIKAYITNIGTSTIGKRKM